MFKGEGGLQSVPESYFRVVSVIGKLKKELWNLNLQESGPRSACLALKLYRAGSSWRMAKMGEPSYGYFYEQMVPKMQPYLDDPPPERDFTLKIHRYRSSDDFPTSTHSPVSVRDLIPENADAVGYYFISRFGGKELRSDLITQSAGFRKEVALSVHTVLLLVSQLKDLEEITALKLNSTPPILMCLESQTRYLLCLRFQLWQ